MQILKSNQFKVEWLASRFLICTLPTEIVVSNYNSLHKSHLDCAYGYHLPDKEFPLKSVGGEYKGMKYRENVRQIAIELHEDFGGDGHVKYSFQNKFAIIYTNEIDLNNVTIDVYRELLSNASDYEDSLKSNDEQLTFNSFSGNWSWGYDYRRS